MTACYRKIHISTESLYDSLFQEMHISTESLYGSLLQENAHWYRVFTKF